jgi:hypothetical protein
VAEVSFDSKEEWIKEVSLIQEDIASRNDDEDAIYEERATKPPDSQSPAGIAWQKVRVPSVPARCTRADERYLGPRCIPQPRTGRSCRVVC